MCSLGELRAYLVEALVISVEGVILGWDEALDVSEPWVILGWDEVLIRITARKSAAIVSVCVGHGALSGRGTRMAGSFLMFGIVVAA